MGTLLAILHFVVAVWAVLNIIGSGATPLAKVLWTLFVLVFPIVGLIAWFLAGPKSSTQTA
ncbi:MAG: PLD nuclease N-terminal domain-containing protein [Aquisalinus sp.]|nr:PLD nuclease N-terminal domain-containing protein [Aquisalinus sp.]